MRKRLYEIIEVSQDNDIPSRIYDWFMMFTIIVSIIPLAFVKQSAAFDIIDRVTVIIFIIDYLLRLVTADYKFGEKKISSFLKYPLSPMAIIDLLSILPSLTIISKSFKLLKLFRMFRTFRVFRAFKTFRYSKNIQIIANVFKKQANALGMVCLLAVGYILVMGLAILNIEPESFPDYFTAVYWATVSLTTMGYGDIYPVTTAGRCLTMISSLFGIAIVALPAGIITGGYMEEINNVRNSQEK